MSSLMSSAIDLMIVGMGFVFVFLLLLVGMTTLMSRLVKRFEPEPAEVPALPRADLSLKTQHDNHNNEQLVAVISAAISRYRSGRDS